MVITLCPMAFATSQSSYDSEVAGVVSQRASNYFTGGTGSLNTMAGKPYKHDPISSGSISFEAAVTDVEVHVTISRGSMPFYLVVESPYGEVESRYVSASTVLHFDEFNSIAPQGTWYIYIYNTGSVFTDVSTASARMKVYYDYTGVAN